MEILFYLLDINHEVVDGRPEIRLWGFDNLGNRVLIIDRSFLPSFYLILGEDVDGDGIAKSLLERWGDNPAIAGVELTDRRYFGKPVKAVKVTCNVPEMARYAEAMAKTVGIKGHVEDDLRYASQYLVARDVYPCGWHVLEVGEGGIDPKPRVDRVYLAKSVPKAFEKTDVPDLRILSFSIICYSSRGAPRPESNPVVIISAATNTGMSKQFAADDTDDGPVVDSFVRLIEEFDPDIIVGYGNNTRDWPYLIERCRKLGVKLAVDRSGMEPHTSAYGHISVTGRANLDVNDLAEDLLEVKVKTLENVADFLGVRKRGERTIIEDVNISGYWEDPEKRVKLLAFSEQNAHDILGVCNATLDFTTQMANLVGLPLDQVEAAAVGFRVEWYLIRQAFKLGELVPAREERPYFPYKGAIVLQPKVGIHEKVAVLDFRSLYPSIMIANNASPDTYIPPDQPEPRSGVYVAPEVNHKFRREPPGFYKLVLSDLIKARQQIRDRMRGLGPKSADWRILDARQRVVKTCTNAVYGYAGWIGARWYVKPVAEATAAWGRYVIQQTLDEAKKFGLEVVYGDTDSIFVRHDPEKTGAFLKAVEERLGLDIRPDEVYERVLFTEAKKRYAGLLPDGRLDIVGLEVARGDWCEAAKRVQESVLRIVLREDSPKKAVVFVRGYLNGLKSGRVAYRDFVIWKTLTKPIESYEVNAPHVAAAKILRKEGWEMVVGDKVGYVIVKGKGKIYDRAKPYTLSNLSELDLDYYIANQVLPAAMRILEIFGVKESDLTVAEASKTLSMFL